MDDLKTGRLEPDKVGPLTFAEWDVNARRGVIRSLIATIADFPELTPQTTALELTLDRVKADRSELGPLLPILASVLTWLASQPKLGSRASGALEGGTTLLLEAGDLPSALKIAGHVLKSAGDMGRDGHGWAILLTCLKQDPAAVWRTLAPLLEGRSRTASRIVIGAEKHEILASLPVEDVMAWTGHDLDRSLTIARMSSVHEAPLDAAARELLIRFGPKSPAATVLSSRAHETPRTVASLAQFYKAQLKHARAWASDPHPRVATWGKEMIAELQRSFESSDAREEYDRRGWGT